MLSGLLTLGLECFGGIHQRSPVPPLLPWEEGDVTVPTREKKKKMTIKYFTKYKEQFCVRSPSAGNLTARCGSLKGQEGRTDGRPLQGQLAGGTRT